MKKHKQHRDVVETDGVVSISSVESRPDESMFNRASGRVHGYSSWLRRYFRLSISFRASLGYSVLLWRMLIPLTILLVCLYGFLQSPNYLARQREALELLPSSEVEGVEVVMLERGEVPDGFVLDNGWGVYWETDPLYIRLQYVEPYGADQDAQLLFSLDEDWRVFKGLFLGLVGMLAFMTFSFMSRGKRLNAKLLLPIQEITETAQQMSEKNLSARINVAGTQNELRDLAVVINDMLNRIEAAYNRQKQFVSDASHELRTPIAVIQGYAGLLDRWGKDNPDVRDESIAAISGETQNMKELVENLLFLARHDKSTLALSYEPFDSAEMLHELVKETELIAKEHHILAGDIMETTLVADRTSVKQAVRIFVDNAVKYTPPGGTVEISSRVKDTSLLITVSDSGPGIKKADLARIFDRFFRADEARSSQTGGHGLGLAIARIIAASHGGRIHARSQPGVGSAFTLEIPLERKRTE
ncbi:HAMP domain-containing histidine kinase [Eubacteriales bacterium OttesenSCG-928-A19]|nr:HAMP domain-containing histidine kinase [Eubacteriales bacterium OttesenSCG-928-A19]